MKHCRKASDEELLESVLREVVQWVSRSFLASMTEDCGPITAGRAVSKK